MIVPCNTSSSTNTSKIPSQIRVPCNTFPQIPPKYPHKYSDHLSVPCSFFYNFAGFFLLLSLANTNAASSLPSLIPRPPLACPLLVRFPKWLEYQRRGWGACLPPMDPDQQSTSQTTPDTWDVRYVRKSEMDKNQCAQHKRGKTVQKIWIFYGLSRLKKQVHIIRAPLSRLCVSTCPMRLSYVCVHVSPPAIQKFTNAFFTEKLKSQNL